MASTSTAAAAASIAAAHRGPPRDLLTREQGGAGVSAGVRDAGYAEGRDVVFYIGSADGLDAQLKQSADLAIRLSSLTLPHMMVRVLLAEQLYRAWSILNHHPYHRI